MMPKRPTSGPAFSNERADRALRFIRNLTHTKDKWAGAPFDPRPWQQTIIRELFGRMRSDDPSRRAYRTCYIEIPRKNGKSEIAAAFALYGLVGDGVQGAEVYSAAADRDQAALVFNVAAQMVRNDQRLESRLKIIDSQKRIVDLKTGSFYRAISAEAYSKHGFNASMVIYDELHVAPNRDLWDVLTTSMGARSEPLVIAITTAGYDRHSICWEQHDYARKILDGTVNDPTFYPVIYAAPDDADWTDEAVWKACNPALQDFRDIDEMRALAHKAREIPALQNTFRNLYLNQWTEQAQRWIDMEAWNACAGQIDWKHLREAMKGRRCVAGLDLSSRTDLTALVLVFEDEDNIVTLVPFFWVPEDGILRRARVDRVPYDQWVRDELITPTPGNVVDQGFIREDINRIAGEYKLAELAFDPWNATKLSTELAGDGIELVELRQGFRSLSEPTKHLGALVTGRQLRHGGHPVLRWMASNMVVRQDPIGNLAPDKSKVTERIDGIVATIFGIAAALKHPDNEPDYQVMFFGGRRPSPASW
jgi:phage terminase large subunit-like protein